MLKKNQFGQFSQKGILRCARYAFMPNKLHFCGPDKNRDLFYYAQGLEVDGGLKLILKEFQTLYPYLDFIAQANKIRDAFDERVVEAYWLGNNLLENIEKNKLYYHLTDNLGLKKKLSRLLLRQVIDKIPLGAKPHHGFHVFNVWKRTGNLDIIHTLNSMDLCRISWGKIKKVDWPNLEVDSQPLALEKDKLKLGQSVNRSILAQISNAGFIDRPKIGDWVSFHWNFACEILNQRQVNNLKKYTKESIRLANA
ncbi:MAG: hypothetical protein CO003_01865 [Candidatus Portnoybacteria bacterium CG_4_8_14_3_um_filter_44_15]|uniref:Uncharacterized protein n=4 Tax=Candidatus Portnoyibacteriota TaxID=1817913 RepID=A0A2M8KGH1_9BACT|nr:MAG: hypothetical protein AUJ11_00115 [Parcubacteria group bacterium CG1_02_44_65]PIP15497.1 MAG: hypothetical protein COX45_02180 [Candidatus Portnoybacteria bacterium CG23_combo_of_CG06-09_8_20_14_all_44_36]PIW74595.1 MAG: hypothetical protein CO003_01865 [Candidatus Portnoybacteria bacterium CG_4_8_14_3_um_filter_44_15]PIZ69160.1 MAG: hypothetical protein COY10_02015 [Candidatus Portnoybacteria bacterium CG_4_10_14_0_2_um_filter_43_36]PJE59019.1 MAG: hypothetical protein COU84_02445 [Cand